MYTIRMRLTLNHLISINVTYGRRLFRIRRLIRAGVGAGRGRRRFLVVDVVQRPHHGQVIGRRPNDRRQVAGARVRRRQEASRRAVAVKVVVVMRRT